MLVNGGQSAERARSHLRCSISRAALATSPFGSWTAGGPGTRVTVLDINAECSRRPRARGERVRASPSFRAMPRRCRCASAAYDAVTIAFGIRNVPRIERALAEAYRVLRIGGRFLCLEFSRSICPGSMRFMMFYSFRVIPALGRAVTGDAQAYRYLVESIRRFPTPQAFAQMMRGAGFPGSPFNR